MGRNKSPERMKLEAILAEDDRWWDREELFNKWAPRISPSVAVRAAQKSYRKNQGKERTAEVSNAQLQNFGARHIFNSILGAMRQYNKIEERHNNGIVEIRLVPEDVSTEFERFTSVVVFRADSDSISVYDPHSRVLFITEDICEGWSDDKLKKLMRWAKLHEESHITFIMARALAQKVLNSRNVDRTITALPKEIH